MQIKTVLGNFSRTRFSPKLPRLLVKSLTAVKFPDISRFSREVVTLYVSERKPKQTKIETSNPNTKLVQSSLMHHCNNMPVYRQH